MANQRHTTQTDAHAPTSSTGNALPIGLDHLPLYHLTDVERATHAFQEFFASPVNVECVKPAFSWTVRRAHVAGINFNVGRVLNSPEYYVKGVLNRYILTFPLIGAIRARHLEHAVRAVAGRSGIIVSPERGVLLDHGEMAKSTTMVIPAATLERHLELLTGKRAKSRIEFFPMIENTNADGESVYRVARAFIHEASRPSGSPLLHEALKDTLLTSLFTCLHHNHLDSFHARPAGPNLVSVRKAEEFVAEHLDEPLTLTVIAKEVGVSARALQMAFQARRGQSPMQFLKERRLERARQRLLRAEPGTTVAAIATSVGMDHLGRFSAEYKKLFGESPSATLRGRRR